jgi:hypothetical protein
MDRQKHKFNRMPQMRESDYCALLDSLRHFGFDVTYRIVVYEGAILDGWNRYRACQELGITHFEKEFVGTDEEAIDFVHRTNTRRNLTPNEQAELIGRYYEDIKMAVGNPQLVQSELIGETPINIDASEESDDSILDQELVYEQDEFSQDSRQRLDTSRAKAAHTYGVSESKVNRSSKYARAVDKVPDSVKEEARAGKISQAEVIRIAEGKPKPIPKPFDKKLMKRKIGAIAFEVEALADTFPATREVCDKVLELCRAAQNYTGV